MDVSFPGLRNQVCASQTTCLYITKHVLHVIYKSMYVYIKYIQINAVLHICIYIHRNTYVCAYIIIIIYTNTYIIYIYYTNIYKYIFIYMHTTIYIWYIMYINNYAHLVRSHLYIYIYSTLGSTCRISRPVQVWSTPSAATWELLCSWPRKGEFMAISPAKVVISWFSWGKIWKNGGTSVTSPSSPRKHFHGFPYDFKVNIVILSHKSWGFWRTRMNHGVWDWFKTNIGWFLIGDVQ